MKTEELYCSLEVSKLAKEKGFDEICEFFYTERGKKIDVSGYFQDGKFFDKNLSRNSANWNYVEQGGRLTSLVAAPTIKQLEEWLSQKEIVVYVVPIVVKGISKNKTKWKSNLHKRGIRNNTPELALNNGLLIALKQLKDEQVSTTNS